MSRPNCLWILVDQLRWHALACHGDPNIDTPNLDRLAAAGADWANAISTCPVCTPARGALMTGQYPATTGVRVLGDLLTPDRRTVAHAFNDAGYRSGYVGKWHLASTQNAIGHNEGLDYWVHPLLRGGFQDWAGFELSNHFWSTRYCTGEQMWPPLLLEGYQTDRLTDLSLAWLAERAGEDQPWFHVLSLEAPHHGSDAEGVAGFEVGGRRICRHPAPPEYEARFDPATLELRPNVPATTEAPARAMLAQYYAMIANLDHNVGRILDQLERDGQAEDTLVVFLSDHGEFGGSHGRFQKCSWLEESLRIPLLMRLPGRIVAGQRPELPIGLADVAPTCAALCGVALDGAEGLDCAPVVTGTGRVPTRAAAPCFWYGNYRYGPKPQTCWTGSRSATATVVHGEDGREVARYDLAADPYQLTNLAAPSPAPG